MFPVTVTLHNGKQYRVQANGVVHVLESNRGGGLDWRIVNKVKRSREHWLARTEAKRINKGESLGDMLTNLFSD